MAEQGAGAILDYGLDWSSFLDSAPGDSIASSAWSPNHPQLIAANATIDGAITSVFLSGGSPGNWYSIDNTITTVVWCLKSNHQIIELAARATDAKMVSALLCHTNGLGSSL